MTGLSVIIVSWNVRELLESCLRSLLADLALARVEAEVWVVDNASTDGTPEMVRRMFPEVKLLASSDNLGFVRGNNLALREILAAPAPPRYLWLLNPDTEVQPGATGALIAVLEDHPEAGAVGPALLYADGSLQHAAFRFPGLVHLAFDLFPLPARLYDTPLNGRYPRRLYEAGKPFPVDHPLGAALMVRTQTVAEVGLLDEGFWMYCEEVDWCWRMHKAGWRIYCVPQARVIHHAGRSSGQVRLSSFVNLWTSRARLYALHHGPCKRALARLLVRLGMQQRIRGAAPELSAACQYIIRAWEDNRCT
ncbi:MAG: glycosyltransferase family 2 protein [Anaerolineae bacterium]|nr:glycosyltransferase family 2 protein [Anaerolineae bacterium]